MRYALVALMFAAPAQAWEFTASPLCTLSHAMPGHSVTVVHDPRASEPYSIEISLAAGWASHPLFAIRFDGPRSLTISTDRHRLSPDSRTLAVSDSGFGNVLNGLEFNETAVAQLGDTALTVSLAGAASEVRAFRACVATPTA